MYLCCSPSVFRSFEILMNDVELHNNRILISLDRKSKAFAWKLTVPIWRTQSFFVWYFWRSTLLKIFLINGSTFPISWYWNNIRSGAVESVERRVWRAKRLNKYVSKWMPRLLVFQVKVSQAKFRSGANESKTTSISERYYQTLMCTTWGSYEYIRILLRRHFSVW